MNKSTLSMWMNLRRRGMYFILLVYFKEVCKLTDFEPVAVIETFA
ncbi:hypothetical protein [Desulfosporosinus shakirovi]|nr:hypothetical protein [Desulfosporosinus sp. SRJS8]